MIGPVCYFVACYLSLVLLIDLHPSSSYAAPDLPLWNPVLLLLGLLIEKYFFSPLFFYERQRAFERHFMLKGHATTAKYLPTKKWGSDGDGTP